MKQMRFIGKILVAALVGFATMCACVMLGASDRVAILTYFGVAAIVAIVLGAFDVKEKRKYESIKHRMGSRSYGQAAVFVGTACLYMGTPQQCEEMADDLWHHGLQAHVETLKGNETFDIL